MRLVISERAKKDLLSADLKNRQRIQEGIDRALIDMRAADVLKIKGQADRWRLRVGDFRVILRIDQAEGVIYALRVVHRKEAYR
ncbi:MAG: type II toxin-antitoxin system RelE/ParE family toxin [Syntrophobacteraceae bacterium]|nr:type II toxin-antitoxin system RelE/ParE family toxin [Syntrophobacteraceae bacterium]